LTFRKESAEGKAKASPKPGIDNSAESQNKRYKSTTIIYLLEAEID
jgi:hypothetical protein